jgi:hypothetical protein
VLWLLVTANVVRNSPILVTLMMEAIHSSETSVLTRATRHHKPEDDMLRSHRREYFRTYYLIKFVNFNLLKSPSLTNIFVC